MRRGGSVPWPGTNGCVPLEGGVGDAARPCPWCRGPPGCADGRGGHVPELKALALLSPRARLGHHLFPTRRLLDPIPSAPSNSGCQRAAHGEEHRALNPVNSSTPALSPPSEQVSVMFLLDRNRYKRHTAIGSYCLSHFPCKRLLLLEFEDCRLFAQPSGHLAIVQPRTLG